MDRSINKIMKILGFTLIEIIIYLGIIAGVLVLTVGFLWNIIAGSIKETAYQEVQQNARFVLTKITQEVRRAVGINNPLPGQSADSLSLTMADPNLNPTVFDLYQGKLRITQGGVNSYQLTTDRVIVENLQFTNLSYENTPGAIRIEMKINHSNPSNLNEYRASINLKTTVSLLEGGASP